MEQPRVGLLNIGEEEGKGNLLAQAAYPLLKENNQIDFPLSAISKEGICWLDKADDGLRMVYRYMSLVILKLRRIPVRHHAAQNRSIMNISDRFDFENYGGNAATGRDQKPVIIGHGILAWQILFEYDQPCSKK